MYPDGLIGPAGDNTFKNLTDFHKKTAWYYVSDGNNKVPGSLCLKNHLPGSIFPPPQYPLGLFLMQDEGMQWGL